MMNEGCVPISEGDEGRPGEAVTSVRLKRVVSNNNDFRGTIRIASC